MELLKQRIAQEGEVKGDSVLRVDRFLNHQIDVKLLKEIALEFYRRFGQKEITKVLTIESSGIAIGAFVAVAFSVPLVFAKKHQSTNLGDDVYTVPVTSFTHSRTYDVTVDKNYLRQEDSVLIVDDFLARGCALEGLVALTEKAHAHVAGIGIVIEKGFQGGGDRLRRRGYPLESLVILESLRPLVYRDEPCKAR